MHIHIVSPSSCVEFEHILLAQQQLQQLGHQVSLSQHIAAQHRYLAGTVQQRIHDLKAAALDPDIDAIWCARGGTGAAQLLPKLGDWILNTPLIGYSDSTVLLNAIAMRGGQALHGPVFQEIAVKNLADASLSADAKSCINLLERACNNTFNLTAVNQIAQQHHSPISGRILGGNLTVLASLQGTAGALTLHQASILMLEDVGEPFYRLERSLDQLLASLDLDQLKAVVMGDFYQCPQKNVAHTLTEIFAEHFDGLNIPLYQNLSFGHGQSNRPFWIGADAVIDQAVLRFMG